MIQGSVSKGYKDLIVWQRAMDLVVSVHEVSKFFPSDERFGLTSQVRRCAVSIPSNLAEGSKRHTRKDYRKFIYIAFGSGAELETQLEIAMRLGYIRPERYAQLELDLQRIMQMMNKLAAAI